MDVENSEFLDFVVAANDNKLEYILIGDLAMILNGAVRLLRTLISGLNPVMEIEIVSLEHFMHLATMRRMCS